MYILHPLHVKFVRENTQSKKYYSLSKKESLFNMNNTFKTYVWGMNHVQEKKGKMTKSKLYFEKESLGLQAKRKYPMNSIYKKVTCNHNSLILTWFGAYVFAT